MELEVNIEKIKNAILKVEKITGKNLMLPILNSILLIASGKFLKLRSTNISLGIEINIPAKIEKEGIVAVSGEILLGVFSNIFSKDFISIKEEDGNLLIKSKKSKVKIKCYPSDDFPTLPSTSENYFITEIDKFINGIKSVYYSAAVSDIKPEISSVFIYKNEDNLIFVSTDQFRLAEKKIKVKIKEDILGILIPFKNIPEIIRVFSDTTGEVKIYFDKNLISFLFENSENSIYLISRVVDGIFPDYRQIIPKSFNIEITVLKEDLLNALKLSNIFSDKFNQINLSIHYEDNEQQKSKIFEVSSQNFDIGENKTQINASITSDSNADFILNYRYFLDCFQSINSDSIIIKTNAPEQREVEVDEKIEIVKTFQPFIVSGVSDNSFTYLIMPIK